MSESMIRRLNENDIPLIAQYLQDDRFDCCEFNDFWTPEELYEWLKNSKDICLGYYIQDGLVGFCLSHFFENANKIYLENIFVDPKYRSRGIASVLLTSLLSMYIEERPGITLRFVALVDATNDKVIRLLKKGGFNVGDQMLWVQKNCSKTQE